MLAVTGSRSEFGHIRELAAALSSLPDVDVGFLVTGSHGEDHSGRTIEEVRSDRTPIWATVVCPTPEGHEGLAASISAAISGASSAITQTRPSWVLVVGDRFESLGSALAAYCLEVPVAHFGGGDVTAGSLDEGFRHSISKLANVHFLTSSEARHRVLQLGESPVDTHIVGNIAVDGLLGVPFKPREDVLRGLGLGSCSRLALVSYHPVTARPGSDSVGEFRAIARALRALSSEWGVVLTGTNADLGASLVAAEIARAQRELPRSVFFASLGRTRFAEVLQHAHVMVGNSSAALTEAPSMGVPAVNVGLRQSGRLRGDSVLDVEGDPSAILEAIERQARRRGEKFSNPYHNGPVAERFRLAFEPYLRRSAFPPKRFHDVPFLETSP